MTDATDAPAQPSPIPLPIPRPAPRPAGLSRSLEFKSRELAIRISELHDRLESRAYLGYGLGSIAVLIAVVGGIFLSSLIRKLPVAELAGPLLVTALLAAGGAALLLHAGGSAQELDLLDRLEREKAELDRALFAMSLDADVASPDPRAPGRG